MKTICAWCKIVLEDGPDSEAVSHGICEACKEKLINVKQHRQIHKIQHEVLDLLVADFLRHNEGKLLSDTPIIELMKWSYKQTLEPEV